MGSEGLKSGVGVGGLKSGVGVEGVEVRGLEMGSWGWRG